MASISDSSEWFYGKQFDLAVEIGTRYGESTLVLNSNASIKRLVTIDPYLQYEDYEHDGQWKNSTNETYEKTKSTLSRHSNIEMVRGMSSEVVDMFEDGSIDFIFIDGNHSYEYVLEDLELYYPKVKNGGVITGDDYFMHEGDYEGKKMVQEAVNDFAEKHSLEIHKRGLHRGHPKNWTFIKQ